MYRHRLQQGGDGQDLLAADGWPPPLFPEMTAFRQRSLLLAGLLSLALSFPALAAPAANPATDPLNALMTDSPFLPAGGSGGPTAQAGALELRSVVAERGNFVFSLYDAGTKESFWSRLNEPGLPFVVRSYDRSNDTITVEQQGRTLSLTLAAARTVPVLAAPTQPPAAVAGVPLNQNPGAPGAPAAANPGENPPRNNLAILPAEEAQRLQRIADEIRRRRNVGRPAPATPTKP